MISKYPSEKESQKFDFSKNKLRRGKAIRMRCLDCCGFQEKEVKNCEAKTCPLWPYRLGFGEDIPLVSLTELRKKAQKCLYSEVEK